ncbi:alpha/beta fold hydrolase [Sinomonas mesophila]|uniref:alpha/beta fold hydrolase n=1 Tax=Sinomonas mesophila TaxID=1531955 RepID=UPI000986ACF3|nr:alpha/beta fold hydrolase [Sinomonas mesophila]
MTTPTIKAVRLSPREQLGERELVVLGPSLGTSTAMWEAAARLLGEDYDLLGWDLPGHGNSPAAAPEDATAPGAFTIAELAEAVVGLVDSIVPAAASSPTAFHYAGDSVGGAVGAELALAHGDRLLSLAMLCSSPKFGTPEMWNERADAVAAQGTAIRIQASAEVWFAPGFLGEHPAEGSRLLHALRDADRFGYAAVCRALAAYDVRPRFGEIAVPFLAIAGEHDSVSPFSDAQWMAAHAQDGTAVELPGVAHIAPTEDPNAVADLLRTHFRAAVTVATQEKAQ